MAPRNLNPSNPGFSATLLMRLTVVTFLIFGIWEARRSIVSGYWWHWFWVALAVMLAATAAAAWRARERGHLLRESALESAVIERTADLDRERRIERERNHILEMLVSNEPLGTVLDAILRLVRSQCPGVLCAIVLKRGDGCHVAAALDVPAEWLTALRIPYGIPFEVWRMPLSNQRPSRDRAWKLFASQLKNPGPAAVYSRPICKTQAQPGAILIFHQERMGTEEATARAAEIGERMARLAIEQSRLYDGLHFQANHDSLTSLPNRANFEERFDRSLSEAEVLGQRLAVLFVDLDRFKEVNDTFSHRVGDLFLCEMAARIKKTLRPTDTVARIGGDEFMIVVNDLKEVAEPADIAARILHAIRQPISIEGLQIDASASIGIAVFPEDGRDAETLQRAADAAMYCAKDLGRDRVETFSTRNKALDRVRMDETLRTALREKYFVVHYQPKVGVDRKLAGFEALVRMNHPADGQIPPMSFIPVAESNGLIVPLGAWVLDEVCRQIAAWQSRGLSPLSVAVNVSPVQISRPDFAGSVQDCLARHGIASSSLELELTESLLINAVGVALEQLCALRTLGVRLSIDDFGTGFSSLSYLHRLPVDAIKLDRSFIQSIDTDPVAHRLVQAMIGVAQGLGLNVIAEGVETEGQRDALLTAGCSLMQGFLFARPQPAGELEAFLQPCQQTIVAGGGTEASLQTCPNANELLQLAALMQLTGDRAKERVPA